MIPRNFSSLDRSPPLASGMEPLHQRLVARLDLGRGGGLRQIERLERAPLQELETPHLGLWRVPPAKAVSAPEHVERVVIGPVPGRASERRWVAGFTPMVQVGRWPVVAAF